MYKPETILTDVYCTVTDFQFCDGVNIYLLLDDTKDRQEGTEYIACTKMKDLGYWAYLSQFMEDSDDILKAKLIQAGIQNPEDLPFTLPDRRKVYIIDTDEEFHEANHMSAATDYIEARLKYDNTLDIDCFAVMIGREIHKNYLYIINQLRNECIMGSPNLQEEKASQKLRLSS